MDMLAVFFGYCSVDGIFEHKDLDDYFSGPRD